MVQKRGVAYAVALSLGVAGYAPLAMAQQASPPAAQPTGEVVLEKIEITGSNIKRADAESFENVQVISGQEIRNSGQSTVSDYLRTISSNFANDFNETFTNSFSPGAAGIGLRGLSPKDTLVLLNGRRITNYGFFQNLSDAFVDLNVIPISAIDRIEIVKSGGSAIYGSDAIAGVVNIILKQNTTERAVSAGGSITTEGGAATRDADIGMGFGNFATDNYNMYFTGSVYKRDNLTYAQRENTAAQDYRNLPDGTLQWGLLNAYRNAAGANTRTAFPTCGVGGNPGQVVNLTNIATSATGTGCYYNNAGQQSLIPGTERANLTGTGDIRINSTWTAFGDVFFSHEKTNSSYTPTPFGAGSWVYNAATGGVTPISNYLPTSNPSNPYGTPTAISYAFQSVGDRDYEVISNTYRVSGGVKGSAFGWDLEGAYGHSQNHVTDTTQNGINGPVLAAEIANGSFDFLNPSSTPAANAALRVSYGNESTAKLDTVTLKGNDSSLFSLPGGKASLALGLEFRHETVDDEPGAALGGGLVLNNGVTKVVGGRSITAAFAEIDLPVTTTVDADLAMREEHYSDVGSSFTPQGQLRWQPIKELTFRAVGSHGFRAPGLAEASNATSVAHQTAYDPLDPAGRTSEDVGFVTGGNPHLHPETSRNLDLGIVFSPVNNVNLSLDYYHIAIANVIAPSGTAQSILANPVANASQIVRAPDGTASYVIGLYTNQYQVETAGYDVDADVTFPLADAAKLSFAFNGTYVQTFQVFNGGNWADYVGTNGWDYDSPLAGGGPVSHWRATVTSTWSNPNWTAQALVHYIDSYDNYFSIPYGITSQASAVVASYTTWDLHGEYKGLKNWKFSATVVNLFNRQPPYDSGALLYFPTHTPYDPMQYDDRGRMIDVHASYSF
jgi:iron complex outermembrane receptor protein